MRDHRRPSFRYYLPARELKAAGMDRTGVLAVEAENQRARLAAEILASCSYCCTMDRVRPFVQQSGGCRDTFFNSRRKLGTDPSEKRAKGDE